MPEILEVLIYGAVSGILGTVIGGIIALVFNKDSKKVMCFLLSFSGGILLALVCFDLIPESFNLNMDYLEDKITSIAYTALAALFGVAAFYIINELIVEKFLEKQKNIMILNQTKNTYIRSGLIIILTVAVLHMLEGIAIGVSEVVGKGLIMAIVITVHNILEGLATAVLLRIGEFSRKNTIILCFLSGLPSVLGAFLGYYIGGISIPIIAACIAATSGAMLYIIFSEMFTQSNRLYKSKFSSMVFITSIMLGFILVNAIV